VKEHQTPPPFVRLFERVATPILRRDLMDTRCVNATRICLDVMRAFNVRALPLSVQAVAMNCTYRAKVAELGRMPTDEELSRWVHDDGAWAIGIDVRESANDTNANAWGGHLIAIVQDWIVDSAALQLSRPSKGISIPDIFIGATSRRFIKGKGSVGFESDNGAILTYTPRPEDESWKTLPGFQSHSYNTEITCEIANHMARMMGRRAVFSMRTEP
jgi:hypothetical protein